MMMPRPVVFSLFLLAAATRISVVSGQEQNGDFQCQSIPGSISVAGASSVERLMNAWAEAYTNACADQIVATGKDTLFRIEGGGAGRGAQRACGTAATLTTGTDTDASETSEVDIAGLTRSLNSGEATVQEGSDYLFDCERSTRSLIQVEVASEGISVATKLGGDASTCISILGGLTKDQLRWIFSAYDDTQLEQAGWDPTSVPNSDNDVDTHLWSEVNSLCPATEIQIGIPETTSILFKELIFSGVDEDFARQRNNTLSNATSNEELVNYIMANGNAISYFELAFVIAEIDQEIISLAPIFNPNEEEYLKPSAASFEANTYPLLRRLRLAMLNDASSLESTRVLLDFGLFSKAGINATKSVGLWPIDRWEKILMATRAQSANGVTVTDIQEYCSKIHTGDAISIAGSSTVYPVARLWSSIYKIGCPATTFVVEGGGSSIGAGRVCGNPEHGDPIDIGDMSRHWKDSEAELSSNGFLYQCLEPGDSSRSAIQIDVAIDGLTVAVKEGGTAWDCIQILGGLSIDQLRWIYSNYSDKKLEETGWEPKSLKNSDFNSQTHLWSELDERCPRVEIRIAGPDDLSGTYEYFLETVLKDHDNGETFDLNRPGFGYENSAVDEELVAYLNEFAESISYFGYSYYYANRGSLSPVAIMNDEGSFVVPNTATIGDGSYHPLARRIFMNLYNSEESLSKTIPFMDFGLSKPELVEATGYVAIPSDSMDEMKGRLLDAQGETSGSSAASSTSGAIDRLGFGSFVLMIVGFATMVALFHV